MASLLAHVDDQLGTSRTARRCRRALWIPAFFHGVPAGSSAVTVRTDAPLLTRGEYDPQPTPPVIRVKEGTAMPESTLIHEIGHYLDHCAFGAMAAYSSDADAGF